MDVLHIHDAICFPWMKGLRMEWSVHCSSPNMENIALLALVPQASKYSMLSEALFCAPQHNRRNFVFGKKLAETFWQVVFSDARCSILNI